MTLPYLVAIAAITLGLPFLILFAIVHSASGVSPSVLSTLIGAMILSTFLVLMVFEIRRIANLPRDSE